VNSQVWWFVARSSGIVAWALLTLSICWGLLLSTRVLSRRVSPAWLLDLHRHLGGLAVVFTGVHLVGLVADSYVTFGWAELFLPMASSWKPGAVAFGIVAFYLLLAIEITSLAMRRLPRSLWRWVHRSSFVLFGFATYHGIVAGTDAGNAWYRVATWASIGVVVALTLVLLAVARRARTRFASLPPVSLRAGGEDVPVDSRSLPLPAQGPAEPLLPAPPAPMPLGPAASAPVPRVMSPTMPTSPFVGISPLGSIEPFVPEAPAGPIAPPRRTPALSDSVSSPVAAAPAEVADPPMSPWLPPAGPATVPVEEQELISVGRTDGGAGEPPTTAT